MMMFRGVQVYCPVSALPTRSPRVAPPVPPEQRSRSGAQRGVRGSATPDSCPGYARRAFAGTSRPGLHNALAQLG